MLLQSVLDGQTETFRRMEQLRETMATKEDVVALRDDLGKMVSVDVLNARLETERLARENLASELDAIKATVKQIERNGLPDWFWPAMTVIVAVVGVVAMFFVGHVQLSIK